MAISPNAKRARNTSESEEKILSKKKKHSEGAAESFSSPLLSKGKKGRLSKAGTPNVGEQKAIKDKASIGSKKGGKETQMKSGRKQKTISKGSGKVSKGKKEPEDGDEESEEDEGGESEEQESEEGGNEEVQGSEDDSDEEAGENEESDDDAEAEENADSDDGGKEAGGNDSDESDSDDDGGEKKDKKPQFGSRNNEFTLFVTNIPYSAEMDDLKKFFSVAGNVKEVRVPVNNKTGRPRGFAFVCMEDEEAMNAALKLDNEEMEGRPLKVQKSLDGGSGGGGGGRFQRGGGGGRWRGDRGGFRGGRGFSRDRRGGGFGGDRGGRGFDRSRGGFSGDRSSSSSSSRGFGERSGGRGFGRGGGGGSSRGGFKGDRDRKGGFERSRGSGRPYDRDSSSKNSRQSGGDSD